MATCRGIRRHNTRLAVSGPLAGSCCLRGSLEAGFTPAANKLLSERRPETRVWNQILFIVCYRCC